jgi:hypothetical protein
MTDEFEADGAASSIDRLPPVVAILAAPGRTMRRIFEQRADRMFVPLLLLTYLSIVLSDVREKPFRVGREASIALEPGIVAALLAAVGALVFIGIFFVFAWVAQLIGRITFGGTGSAKDVRMALAWGLTPVAWALVYRIPLAIWAALNPRAESTSIDFMNLGDHVLLATGILALDLCVLVSYLVVSTFTLAVGHRITPGESIGTLVLTFLTPVVIALSAALASM